MQITIEKTIDTDDLDVLELVDVIISRVNARDEYAPSSIVALLNVLKKRMKNAPSEEESPAAKQVPAHLYEVPSESYPGTMHIVAVYGTPYSWDEVSCTCPSFKYRGTASNYWCKHIRAASFPGVHDVTYRGKFLYTLPHDWQYEDSE